MVRDDVADAYDPYPDVDEKHKAYLRERFGPKSNSGQEQEQPPGVEG